jgi:hypothetical protein
MENFYLEEYLIPMHKPYGFWIPAFAGMTVNGLVVIKNAE